MAMMNSQQIAAELQRKRNQGIAPTSKANLTAYTGLNAQKPAVPLAQPKVNEGYSGVRSYFEGNGYKDVGYDPSRKMVTVGGMDALSPGQNVGGTSYASQDALSGALSRIKNTESTKKTNDLLGRLETSMNTPYVKPEFNYDPTTDPAYQSALNRAKANSETASGNAMAELNRRGILNSTITGDRIGQIQQGEYSKVSDTILPQLMTQAYQRHRDTVGDQYQQSRNNVSDTTNLLGLTNNANQQQLDNQYRGDTFNRGVLESDRGFNRGVLESDRGFNRGVTESDRGFNRGILESDRGFNRGALESDRSFKQSAADSANSNARGWAGIGLNREQFNWSKDPANPDNAPKYSYKTDPEYANTVQDVIKDPQALDNLKIHAAELIRKYGKDGYDDLVTYATPKKKGNILDLLTPVGP